MLAQNSIEQIGEDLLKKIIKMEVLQLDQFLDTHSVEFRLKVLDQVYMLTVKPDVITQESSQQIWTDLWSAFLADYNQGLVAKVKSK